MVDADEARAVRLLEQAGLVPGVRHTRGGRLSRRPVTARRAGDVRARPGARATMGRAPSRGLRSPTPDGPVEGADLSEAAGRPRPGRRAAVGGGGHGRASSRRPAATFERRDRGLHGGMQFTYRNPDRSTDPGRILPGARSLVVGAWSYRRPSRRPPTDPRPRSGTRPADRGAWPATPGRDHYASLRRALGPDRRAPPGPGVAGHGGLRRQRPGRPGRRPPGRARLVREELPPAPARRRLVVRAGLGGHRCAARPTAPEAAPGRPRRGVRELPPLPRRLPDRRPGGPRGPRRPSLPGLAGAGPGLLPRGVPRGAGRPHLRVRRLPAGLPDQPDGRPPATRRLRRPAGQTRPPGRPARPARGHRRGAAGGPRPVVHRRSRPPLPAAQRPGGPGQRRGRRPTRHRAGPAPLAGTPTTRCSSSTPAGPPAGWAGTTWWPPAA